MCVNCLTTAEAYLSGAALVAAIVKEPLHRALGEAGLVAPYDPVAADARAVAFLRALDVDPVEAMGADVVARADAWAPQPYVRRRRSLLPIGSQRRLATR